MKYVLCVGKMMLHLYIYNNQKQEWEEKKQFKLTHREVKFIIACSQEPYASIKELAVYLYGSTDRCAYNCVKVIKNRLEKDKGIRITTKYGLGYKLIDEVEIC